MSQNQVFIELGGNIGDRFSYIAKAKSLLTLLDCNIIKQSSIYETPPWGFSADQNFYNQIIEVTTNLNPFKLIIELQKIEEHLGRIRNTGNYESRTMDLDILFYNAEILNDSKLIIPHPKLHLRKFVLVPMCEIAPNFVHPLFELTMQQLLIQCPDTAICLKVSN